LYLLDTGISFARRTCVPEIHPEKPLLIRQLPSSRSICDNNFMSLKPLKKYYLRTFGCQMNFHDSEKIAGLLSEKGYVEAPDHGEADLVIFNTCSIREKAEQKFLSELGRLKFLKRKRPHLKIMVSGCIAQQMGEELLKRAPFVDYLLGPQNLGEVRNILEGEKGGGEKGRGLFLENNPALAETDLPALRKEKPKAWVSIMFGCDNFCSYCIVPYTRGREVSRPSANIIEEIKGLAREGFKEVTLLGQNVNSYRSDTDFPGLLRRIHEIQALERVRFVTSHPRDLSDELIEVMAEYAKDKICEHIHLPIQSGSGSILEAMKRGYVFSSYKEKINKIREKIPQISITTDIIAGFPGERDEDHRATLGALQEVQYDGIFAFMYSPRPGTPASELEEQVPLEIKRARLSEVLALQDMITSAKNKALKGTIQEVLVEGVSQRSPDQLTGRTRTNKVVNFRGPLSLIGELVNIRIVDPGRHSLGGELL